MKYINAAVFFLILIVSSRANAQRKEQLISGNFSKIPFEQFVQRVERESSYRFFYDKRAIDTLLVDVSASQDPLNVVLTKILEGTTMHFAIDPANRVFITSGRPILAELPPGFFGGSTTSGKAVQFDYSAYEKKEKEIKLAENKVHIIGKNTGTQTEATVAGNIRDINTGEPLIGASVFVQNDSIGASTDQFGYFALTLPVGRHELRIQSVGMKTTSRQILLYSNGRLDIEMDEDIKPLKEIVVEAEGDAHVLGMQMGTEKLDIKTMKQIPLATS
jgi:hypothetical protein